jgi:hypothetical protein
MIVFALAFGIIGLAGGICFALLSLVGLDTGTKLAVSTGAGIVVMWIVSHRLVNKTKPESGAQQRAAPLPPAPSGPPEGAR